MTGLTHVAVVLAMAAAVSALAPIQYATRNPFLPSLQKVPERSNSRSVVENFITQRVDNFDAQNEATYEQRYLMNGEFFQPGGPIILMIGGLREVDDQRLLDSMPLNVARELRGYGFYLEHRYFGKSFPTA